MVYRDRSLVLHYAAWLVEANLGQKSKWKTLCYAWQQATLGQQQWEMVLGPVDFDDEVTHCESFGDQFLEISMFETQSEARLVIAWPGVAYSPGFTKA